MSCVSADFVRLKDVLTHFACSLTFRTFDVFRTRLLSKSLSSRMSLAFGLLRPNSVAGVIHLTQGIKSVHSISRSRCQPGPWTSTAAAWRHSDESFHDFLFRSVAGMFNDGLLPSRSWRMWTLWRRLRGSLPVQRRRLCHRQLRCSSTWISISIQRWISAGIRCRRNNRIC